MSGADSFLQGLDVSKYQSVTPSLTGAFFLIARRGIGTKLDATYDTHIANAKKAGLMTGSYWYGIGNISTMTVSEEVNAYIASEGKVDHHVLDWEGADGFTAAQAKLFLALYKQRTGNRIWLYASESKFRDLGQDFDWVANYSREPSRHWDMWQYGPFRGADGDLFNGTLNDLRVIAGFSGADMNIIVTATPFPDGQRAFKSNVVSLRRFTAEGEQTPIATPYSGYVDADVSIESTGVPHGSGFLRLSTGGSAGMYVLASEVLVSPAPVVVPPVADCTDAVNAAQSAAVASGIEQGKVVGAETERQRIRELLGL